MKRIGKQRMMATVTRETGGDRKFTSLSHPRSPSRGLADWVVLAVLALGMTHTPAAHATLMVDFDVSFNGDARLTGMFDAQDINKDMIITANEVSAITTTYHPGYNDVFEPETVTLTAPPDNLTILEFNLTSQLLLDLDIDTNVMLESIEYAHYQGDPIVVFNEAGQRNEFYYEESRQTNSVSPAAVPEPTTIALLSLGFAGLGFAQRKMKS